jgi:hypothetical membrane protein
VGDPAPRRLSQAALGGIGAYVAVDIALVFLRPGFSVLHNAESDYGSRGPYGWVMDLNFGLRCLLSLAVVAAIAGSAPAAARSRLGLALLATWAIGSGLLAFFPDDPAGTKVHTAGRIHVALAAIAFLAVLVGTFVTARGLRADARFRRPKTWLFVVPTAALVALLLLGHAGFHPHSLGALWEKIFLGLELAWFALVAATIAVAPGEPGG